MEEWVGERWHRWVTARAERRPAEHEARLADALRAVTLLLHAGGARQRVALATPVRVGGERSFWQKVAGSGQRLPLAQLDDQVLALPERIAVFDSAELNYSLYLWWAALAASADPGEPWVACNEAATARALECFPGLKPTWQRLVAAEGARAAPLLGPARVADHPPRWTWLVPCGQAGAQAGGPTTDPGARPPGGERSATLAQRRRARRNQLQPGRAPLLLAHKGEALKTFADPLALDRGQDDEDDGSAPVAAEELEHIELHCAQGSVAARVRFDLDLPAAGSDDAVVTEGERLPEWDPRAHCLQPARVAVQCLAARSPAPWLPGPALRATARTLRQRLALQQAAPRWQRGVSEGEAIDLDAFVLHRPGRQAAGAEHVYQRRVRGQRELATLLLADLSLSTDAFANDTQRIIDVIREALYVFGEALAGSGDAFAMWGFSSVRRQLRLHELKGFEERWGAAPQARLGALKPGYYTRMGAALRAGTARLGTRPERQRLLLLLTDGKPHDLDGYEGRLGLEDTRQAVLEARRAGLLPFALSIDEAPGEVMEQLFGHAGWAWVRQPKDLPQRLAGLYAQLTRA